MILFADSGIAITLGCMACGEPRMTDSPAGSAPERKTAEQETKHQTARRSGKTLGRNQLHEPHACHRERLARTQIGSGRNQSRAC